MKNFLYRSPGRSKISILLASLTLAVVAHAAGVASVGAGESSFLAVGPAGLTIEGTGNGVTAKEEDGTITVKAPLTDLKTGISLRDQHLKDAIKADKHPNATLAVKRKDLTFPGDKESAEKSAKGAFTFHGVTKQVDFKYKVSRTGSDYHVQGATTIDIEKFGMELPCYLGVCVEKDVKVKVKFKVRDN